MCCRSFGRCPWSCSRSWSCSYLSIFPEKVGHAERRHSGGRPGGVVHVPAETDALLVRLLSLFNELHLTVPATAVGALHDTLLSPIKSAKHTDPLERFVSLKHFSSAMSSRHAGPGPQRSGVVTTDAHHPSRPEWRHTCPSTPRTRTPSKNRFFVVGQNSSALGWDRVVVGFRIIPGCPLSGAGVPLSGVLVWLLNGCPPAGGGGPWWGSRPPAGMVCGPAVSYSPTRSRVQYHRRWKA